MIDDLVPYPEYTESGQPWLGQVPAHWEVRKPRQVGALLKGVGGTRADALSSGVPCVRYGDLYTTHTFFVRKPRAFIHPSRTNDYTPIRYGDVLFAASGETLEEIGKSAVNLIEGPAVCGGDVIILRPSVPVHAPYLGYAMDCRPSANQKATMGRGTTVKHIYPDELKHLLFPFPPPAEQEAIARFLDWANRRLERAIRAKRKVIALLDEQKQVLIHHAVTRGLDPSVPLTPSGIRWLGDIPEHWEVVPLGTLTSYVSYGFTNPMPTTDQGPYLLTAADIAMGIIQYAAARRTSEYAFQHLLSGKSRPRAGDLLITKDGTLGRVAIADGSRVCINQSVALVRLVPNGVSREFIADALQADGYQQMMVFDAGGTTIKHIYITRLVKMKMALPPLREQLAIAADVGLTNGAFRIAREKLANEIELLHEYRTRLTSDVVTGKLDVRVAAKRLPDEGPLESVEDDAGSSDEAEVADDEAAA